MAENTMQWETPLARQLADHPAAADSGVQVVEWPQSGIIILRGKADDSAFVNNAHGALGAALPLAPRGSVQAGNVRIFRLSPDEWLLVCPYAEKQALLGKLEQSLAGVFAQVVDNSGGYTALVLYGQARLRVLRHLTPFDVDSLQVGHVAGTVMSKSHVILVRPDVDRHEIIVRRSFADYVWKLVVKAARPYGLAVRSVP